MLLRLAESVHGHLGVLAAVGLLHPALLLRRGQALSWRNKLAVVLSTGVTAATFVLGLAIYGSYRTTVRPILFALNPDVGWLFETKEHLAFAVLAMSLAACVCALLAPQDNRHLRRAAARLYAAAFLGCVSVAVLGTYVASVAGFEAVP